MKVFGKIRKPNLGNARVRNLVVLDIGTQFLKALFLENDTKEEKGVLRTWVKEKIGDDFEGLYPICQKAIDKAQKKAGLKAEKVFLGIGGDIVKGLSTSFLYKREKPNQKIDLPELKYLVQKTQWKALDEIRKKFALETGLSEMEARIISAHIINIKVDNNSIANPLGFQGKNLCLTIFNNYTSAKQLEDLLDLSSKLGLELAGINSSGYALFNCLEMVAVSNKGILIIDIGGKVTEAILIGKGGEIMETRSFNLGGYSFTQTLSNFLEIGADEAEAIKLKYSKNQLGPKAKIKLEKLLNPNFSSWSGGIGVILDEFFKKYKVRPCKILLCGGGSNLLGIKETLKNKGNFKIKLISPREIIKIENRTKMKDIPCLALANLALESSEAEDFSSVLNKAIRLIQN